MIGLQISTRERRTLAIGAFLMGAFLASAKGMPAWLAWQREARSSAAEMHHEATRAERSLHGLRETLDTLEQRQQRLAALAPTLVGGDSPATAAAALASLVSGAAVQAAVRLGATSIYVDSAHSGVFTRVGVRGEATGDVRGLAKMLAALEQGPKMLAVRELSVSQPDPAAGAGQPEVLRIEFVVEGLALGRGNQERPK